MINDKKSKKDLDRISKLFNSLNGNKQEAAARKKGKAILKEEKPIEKQTEIAATMARLQDLLKVQGEPFIQQYAYKVAYETDQKCVKPQITIYSNELETAIKTGVLGLKLARAELQQAGFVAAPLGEVASQ